ncbi:MAG: hypothetical protein IM551_08340, partial [Chitinophagaceae bacterium]|nr:hypothetical protein [Chitinophagaceae bacterium]
MLIKNTLLSIFLLVASPLLLQAQNTEAEIKQVINNLFEGMRNADSAAVAGVFSYDCTMQTIATDKAGKALVK